MKVCVPTQFNYLPDIIQLLHNLKQKLDDTNLIQKYVNIGLEIGMAARETPQLVNIFIWLLEKKLPGKKIM